MTAVLDRPTRIDEHILERRRRVAMLTRCAKSTNEIAVILRISTSTVHRDRVELGITDQSVIRDPLSRQEVETIAHLLEDECPLAEIARTVGCSPQTITRRFPDRAPGVGQPVLNSYHRALAVRLGLPSL